MEKHIVIGIEGLVGSGKTSMCRELLNRRENTVLLHGGNLYRTIVYALLKEEPNIHKLRKKMKNIDIKKCMDDNKIEIKIENRETVFYIDGVLANEDELQSKASSMAVSIIGGTADNTKLFEFAREYINDLKKENDVILSGRAIMQIYPGVDYHIFVKASLKERIKRKTSQYSGKEDIRGIKKNIIIRDLLQKIAGFYKIYKNTIVLDVTNCKSVEDSTDKLEEIIKNV